MAKRMHKESGGSTDPHKDKDVKPYDAQGSNVEKEAEEKKRGGRAKKREHKVTGGAVKMRLDRARGGRTGSDKSPLTSAHNLSSVPGHSTDD
jgi:hypothetical protein